MQRSSSPSPNGVRPPVETRPLPEGNPKYQRIPKSLRKVTQINRSPCICPLTPDNTHFSSTPYLMNSSAPMFVEGPSVSGPLLPSSPAQTDSLLDLNEEELSGVLGRKPSVLQPQNGPSKISTGQQTCAFKHDMSFSEDSFEDDETLDFSSLSTSLMIKPNKHIVTHRKSKDWTLEIKKII